MSCRGRLRLRPHRGSRGGRAVLAGDGRQAAITRNKAGNQARRLQLAGAQARFIAAVPATTAAPPAPGWWVLARAGWAWASLPGDDHFAEPSPRPDRIIYCSSLSPYRAVAALL